MMHNNYKELGVSENKDLRIAIFMPYAWLSYTVTIIEAIEVFLGKGYEVDIVQAYSDEYPIFKFNDTRVSVYYYTWGPGRTFLQVITRKMRFLFSSFMACHKKKYKYLFGIDAEGLIIAWLMNFFLKAPIIYYSLELYLSKDNPWKNNSIDSFLYSFRKKLERIANAKAVYTITQNEYRVKALSEDNGIKEDRVIILPYAPRGHYVVSDHKWWHKKFNIPEHKKIILHLGSITDWYYSRELANAALSWPDEWVLVFHGKTYISIESIIEKSKGRIFISNEWIAYNQLDKLIASADIGIALYKNIDYNHFSTSSGKLSYYLRCGVPVVAQKFPALEELVDRHKCGICVNDVREIKMAIDNILLNYQEYSFNAKKVFSEHLDFNKFFPEVLKKLQ